jgi:hypothetical protein
MKTKGKSVNSKVSLKGSNAGFSLTQGSHCLDGNRNGFIKATRTESTVRIPRQLPPAETFNAIIFTERAK